MEEECEAVTRGFDMGGVESYPKKYQKETRKIRDTIRNMKEEQQGKTLGKPKNMMASDYRIIGTKTKITQNQKKMQKNILKQEEKLNSLSKPKKIEEHIFRIVQELISNTLRHAQASCLDVYLYQTETELQLKVVDNGRGFQLDDVDELSYGLRNIKERVEDMAGSIQLLTAPKQGLAVDIRIPLLD